MTLQYKTREDLEDEIRRLKLIIKKHEGSKPGISCEREVCRYWTEHACLFDLVDLDNMGTCISFEYGGPSTE